MTQKKDIKNIISEVPEIPTMPSVVVEALNVIKDPKSSMNQLSDVISKDISLTTQILKIVNSAYYGFPKQITTISKAMALLGMIKVKSLIMSVALKPMLMSYGGKSLWEHSIRCAVGCEIIAQSLNTIDPDEAFTIGLLHDVGKTVLEICNKAAFSEVSKLVNLGAEILKVEKIMFGFDHTEAGAELVLKWNLPNVISNCIKYHHAPHHSDNPSLVGIVYVADRVAQQQLKYPILETEITNTFDFDLPEPMKLREEVFEKSELIISALSK